MVLLVTKQHTSNWVHLKISRGKTSFFFFFRDNKYSFWCSDSWVKKWLLDSRSYYLITSRASCLCHVVAGPAVGFLEAKGCNSWWEKNFSYSTRTGSQPAGADLPGFCGPRWTGQCPCPWRGHTHCWETDMHDGKSGSYGKQWSLSLDGLDFWSWAAL